VKKYTRSKTYLMLDRTGTSLTIARLPPVIDKVVAILCRNRTMPLRKTTALASPSYGLDFLEGFTGIAFFGAEGFRIRSTFQVRITCG
jgi:hypothetical protein